MIVNDVKIYDGAILQDRFAYDYFKDQVLRTGNIVTYRAPMKVEQEFMVDKEDLVNSDFIYSDDAINLLIEIPEIPLYAGVCFQRLYISVIANILASESFLNCPVEVDGDDVWIIKEHNQGGIVQQKGKASVSIAKHCNDAVLIHIGFNVNAGKQAPAFAFSTELSDEQVEQFMNECIKCFYEMTHDIWLATTKIIK